MQVDGYCHDNLSHSLTFSVSNLTRLTRLNVLLCNVQTIPSQIIHHQQSGAELDSTCENERMNEWMDG